MPRDFIPKIITANALLEGDVVYLTETDGWSRQLAEAEILTDEADAQLRLLMAQAQASQVVDAYLVNIAPGANGPEPTHFREEFRRTGPSNYFHGKQAEQ